MVLGTLLALLALKTRSIVPSMLCHFTHNGLALVIVSRTSQLEQAGLFADGRPTWALRAAALLVIAIGVTLLYAGGEEA
jgi:hypothetical protein